MIDNPQTSRNQAEIHQKSLFKERRVKFDLEEVESLENWGPNDDASQWDGPNFNFSRIYWGQDEDMRLSANVKFCLNVALLCMIWYIESSCSNILNKTLLQKFPFPLTITMSALVATGFLSVPLMNCWQVPVRKLQFAYLLKYILPLSVGKIFALAMAFTSIWKVPVSYAHTVKATMPLFAVFCARVILGETQTFRVYLSLAPIICGVVVATCTELSFNIIGLLMALGSTLSYALLNTFVKKVLRDSGVHHLKLLSMIAQVSCAFLLPFWCLHDLVAIWKDFFSPEPPVYMNITTVYLVVLSGILNFLQNVVSFTLIHKLSALSYAVANCAKRITVIGASLVMLRNPVTPLNILGMSLAIFGVFGYNRAKQCQKEGDKEHFGLHPSLTHVTLSDATLFQKYKGAMEKGNGRNTSLTMPEGRDTIMSNFFRRNGFSKQTKFYHNV